MRIKILFFSLLFASHSWATNYVYPGNATAPLTLRDGDTLTVESGTFNGDSAFTVMNSNTALGESVTIDSGATLSSSTFALYLPYHGPFTILNNGVLSGTTAAILGAGSDITLTQNSTTAISGLINLGSDATINFDSTAGTDNTLYVGENSTVNFNSSGSPSGGIVGATGTIANINHTISLAAINLFDTINVNTGTTTLTGGISNLSAALNVASGATLALGNTTISGVGAINQAGTFTSSSSTALAQHTGKFTSSGTTTLAGQTLNDNFVVSGGTTSITGTSSFIINNICTLSGGTLDAGQTVFIINNNASMHQTGGTFKVNSSGSSGSFQIGSGGNYTIDGGTFARGASGTNTITSATFQLNGGVINFASEATWNNSDFIITGGTFNYTASSAMTINGGNYVQSGGAFIANSSAGIFNNPNTTVTVSGGTLQVADTVFVENNVNVYVSGQPTIIMSGGTTFLSNIGVSVNIAFGDSTIPLIQLPNTAADFSKPVVNITNDSNAYLAPGDYVFLTAAGAITVDVVNLPANNQFVQYSLGEALGGAGLNAFVHVTRTGLDQLAVSDVSQAEGAYLEEVGATLPHNSANEVFFTALDSLQSTTDMLKLDEEIFQLSPQFVTTFANLAMVDTLFQQIDTHLLALREKTFYASGDELYNNDVWMAPFGDFARQNTHGSLSGYTAKSGGVVLGIDHELSSRNSIGLAGSYTNSRIVPTQAPNSHTTVQYYQITAYGTHNFTPQQHLDWLLAYNTSTNFSWRSVDSVAAVATAKYRVHDYAAKLIYSKDIFINRSIKLAPELNGLYVNLHQKAYTEAGAGTLDYNVEAENTSLLRLGIGGWATFIPHGPCDAMVPQLYGTLTYDAKAATQNVNANFINTAPLFSSAATTPRLGGIAGARITIKLKDNLNLIGNLNFQIKNHYLEKYGDLRLKYYF